MQEALQRFPHSVQPVHFSVSMTGRKSEKRESRPSVVPTGQTVLHQVRPPRQAITTTTMNVTTATMNTGRLLR